MIYKLNLHSDQYDTAAGVAWCQRHGVDPVRILDCWIDTATNQVTFLQMIDGKVNSVSDDQLPGGEFPEGVTARRAALDHQLIVKGLTSFGPDETIPPALDEEMNRTLLCVCRVVELIELPAEHLLYGGWAKGGKINA